MTSTRHMLTIVLAVAVAPCLADSGVAAAPAAVHAVDPLTLYGPMIEFSVRRNGTPVGSHVVRFENDGNGLKVASVFDIKIDFLFFTAYRYRYESESVWVRDRLMQLRAVTNDDGAKSTVEAAWRGETFFIRGPEGEATSTSDLFPTNHWNPGVLATSRVLNTITGRINDVRIVRQGTERIVAEGRAVPATHYRYTGDLENEVWYDDRGRWVKMRFKGKDGSTIDYECRRCLGPMPQEVRR